MSRIGAMAWDWIEKGAKRLQELGGEYKQHHALIERLLTIDPVAARDELVRAWGAMDDRARAGVKMTLAGLTLSQQAASATAAARIRAERLKALQTAVDRAGHTEAASAARTASGEAAFVAGAAQVTQKIAGVAERARPKAEEAFQSAKRGFERHAPAVEAAVKSVFTDFLKTESPGAKRNAPKGPAPAAHLEWRGQTSDNHFGRGNPYRSASTSGLPTIAPTMTSAAMAA